MNKIERMKQEKEGLSILPDIYMYAKGAIENVPEEDIARMRWYGLFYRKREGGFMLRVRVPSGKLACHQAEKLADIAERYGDGIVTITTRMGAQIRKLALHDLPEVLEALRDSGLDSRQTGLDNVRNLMNCPVAGIQEHEAFDASEILNELSKRIVGNPIYANLPRKFNISVTGCYEDCGHSRLNDIGLIPQVIPLKEGVKEGFRIRLGGAIGKLYASVAKDLGVWVPKEKAVECVMVILDLFREHGTRENRNKARMLHLIEHWGTERLLGEINTRLDQPLTSVVYEVKEIKHHDHIGIHPQKQKGYFYAGLCVPNGKMTSNQCRELARLANKYGRDEIRFTAQQNAVIPHIPEINLRKFQLEPLLSDLPYNPTPLHRGLVTCTGKEGCDLAIVDTKTPAIKLLDELEERLVIRREELRIHWSGCPNSCAVIQTGDIGLRGTKTRVDGELVDAVDIFYGGHIGHDARIGTLLKEKVPVRELADTLADLLTDERYFTGIYAKKQKEINYV
ncbi:hypothetical protein [Aneurinibacillus tyrosinisolvens]|uniref:hypothetical protein n=1 Tax=Aneurinibacillus tyrosinisolvens TaxID=1443435 RepID=UPI00063FC907|nr:hypothetical protein [Aneurinibacillus tyrosinisolvens]